MDELFHDENTLVKVYSALLENGIYGQKATDIVSTMQNKGILFRENKPKRRGRPPAAKPPTTASGGSDAVARSSKSTVKSTDDAWAPKEN